MSNGLSVRLTSLTFKGTDIQRSNLELHCDIVSGLNDGIELRGEDTVIPGAEGMMARTRVKNLRRVILRATIQPVGTDEDDRLAAWQTLRDEMETLFDPTVEGTLAGVANDGSTRSIDVRPEDGWVWEETAAVGVETAVILMTAVDPNWQVSGS